MTTFEQAMGDILTEHADVWEALAKGSTALEREVAFVLRSIVAEIEGPHPANRDGMLASLRWCWDVLEVKRTPHPAKACVPWDSDPGLTDSSTWVTDSSTWVPDGGWAVYSGDFPERQTIRQ